MSISINSRPDNFPKLPHHGYNLSHDFAFTAPVAYLLPVNYDILMPGDKVSLDFNINTITNPLAKPCMSKITERIDTFFVPFKKLRTLAPEIITNVNDLSTSYVAKGDVNNGKVFPLIDLKKVFNFYISDLEYGTWSDFLLSGVDLLGRCRLLEHLGYNSDVFGNYTTQWYNHQDYQPKVNPCMLLAYQAIYFDYYRLSNFFENDVKAYNIDFLDLHSLSDSDVFNFTTLRSRSYHRDYFKNIEASPLQGSIGVLVNSNDLSFNSLSSYLSGDVYGVMDENDVTSSNPTNITTDSPSNTVTLRTAFAVEKFLRVTQRAGKHYDDQVAAHFGVKVPQGMSNEVYYLGTHMQRIEFGAVVSTASSEDNPLGNLAGRGYALKNGSNKTVKFTAPCHGVLMSIYSAEPDITYHTGIDKIHTMSEIFDYPWPEFDKLGMQPLFGFEKFAGGNNVTNRLGWQYRYAQLKQKYDRCTYAFTNSEYGYNETQYLGTLSYGFGAYSPYLIVDPSLGRYTSGISFYRYNLFVRPNDTDQIFLMGFNPLSAVTEAMFSTSDGVNDLGDLLRGQLSNMYTTDPLINQVNIRYFKTSFMSTFGEPDI